MRNHKVCFHREIRKIIPDLSSKSALSGALIDYKIAALISYQAEGWPKRTDSPSEHSSSGMNQHPEEIPDLLDANTRRCLNAGQVKLVWNKVVGVNKVFTL